MKNFIRVRHVGESVLKLGSYGTLLPGAEFSLSKRDALSLAKNLGTDSVEDALSLTGLKVIGEEDSHRQADDAKGPGVEQPESPEEEANDELPPYEEWSYSDLRAEVASRSLDPKSRKKEHLIEALVADDSAFAESEEDSD